MGKSQSHWSHRVAVGSIFIECNHLGGVPTTLEFFERSELRRGSEILALTNGTVGGMLQVLRACSVDIVPLMVATSCSNGPLTSECYNELRAELLGRLVQALPVDGVLLALHGSGAADDAGDLEGDLLSAVRQAVGKKIPVVATLDLHAHVTEAMVQAADALLAWETYPHRDAFETGERGAHMLVGMLDGEFSPTMALAKAPVIVGGVHGGTEGDAPFADIMRLAKSFEQEPGVLSASAFLVHPYLDLPDMGGGGLVITDNDLDAAVDLARQVAEYYWSRRFDLEAEVSSPPDAIQAGLQIEGGPVLLAEVADTCGGGAAGDNVTTLKALLESDCQELCLVPVVDPAAAAAACHRAGVGSDLRVNLGHALDPQWGQPLQVTGKVVKLADGRFRYSGGIYGGTDRRDGPLGRPRSRTGSDPRDLSCNLRLGRRTIPLDGYGYPGRKIHRRQKPHELRYGLRRDLRESFHSRHSGEHASDSTPRYVQEPQATLFPSRYRDPRFCSQDCPARKLSIKLSISCSAQKV